MALVEFPRLLRAGLRPCSASRGDALKFVAATPCDVLYLDPPFASPASRYQRDLGFYDKLVHLLNGRPELIGRPRWLTVRDAIGDLENRGEAKAWGHIFPRHGPDLLKRIRRTPFGELASKNYQEGYYRNYPDLRIPIQVGHLFRFKSDTPEGGSSDAG